MESDKCLWFHVVYLSTIMCTVFVDIMMCFLFLWIFCCWVFCELQKLTCTICACICFVQICKWNYFLPTWYADASKNFFVSTFLAPPVPLFRSLLNPWLCPLSYMNFPCSCDFWMPKKTIITLNGCKSYMFTGRAATRTQANLVPRDRKLELATWSIWNIVSS